MYNIGADLSNIQFILFFYIPHTLLITRSFEKWAPNATIVRQSIPTSDTLMNEHVVSLTVLDCCASNIWEAPSLQEITIQYCRKSEMLSNCLIACEYIIVFSSTCITYSKQIRLQIKVNKVIY